MPSDCDPLAALPKDYPYENLDADWDNVPNVWDDLDDFGYCSVILDLTTYL